jgi:hypothetical protein
MSGEEPASGPTLRTAPPTSYPADHLVALGLVLALAGFLGVGIAYGTILWPISIAFNDPLHTNPVTSAGKALMREAGPLQFLAALAALLLLSVSVMLKARAILAWGSRWCRRCMWWGTGSARRSWSPSGS